MARFKELTGPHVAPEPQVAPLCSTPLEVPGVTFFVNNAGKSWWSVWVKEQGCIRAADQLEPELFSQRESIM